MSESHGRVVTHRREQLPDTKSRMVRRVFQELVEYDRHVCFYGDFAWLPKANRNSDLAAGYGRTNADNVRPCPPGETEDPRADGHGHHPIGAKTASICAATAAWALSRRANFSSCDRLACGRRLADVFGGTSHLLRGLARVHDAKVRCTRLRC